MARFAWVWFLFSALIVSSFSQTASTGAVSNDPQAIAISTKAISALTHGLSLKDAKLDATVTWIAGSTNEVGVGTFEAKGINESRVDLTLGDLTDSEVRTSSGGTHSGQRKNDAGKVSTSAQHNCWTDAAWFFPALSSLTQITNPSFVFSYVGEEQHNGLSSLHIKVVQLFPGDTPKLNLSRLGVMDFYLDPTSFLPSAEDFNVHTDDDMNTDIPVEVRFANYQIVNGVNVPFHIQKLFNGTLLMDVAVNRTDVNSGMADSQFILQ